MAEGFIPLSKRVGYTTAQIRLLFGLSDGKGNIIPLHPNTVERWRKKKKIPFVQLNCRNYRYPRAEIDALLLAKQEHDAEMEEERHCMA